MEGVKSVVAHCLELGLLYSTYYKLMVTQQYQHNSLLVISVRRVGTYCLLEIDVSEQLYSIRSATKECLLMQSNIVRPFGWFPLYLHLFLSVRRPSRYG